MDSRIAGLEPTMDTFLRISKDVVSQILKDIDTYMDKQMVKRVDI